MATGANRKVSVNVNATPLIFAGGVIAVIVAVVVVIAIIRAIKNAKGSQYFKANEKAIVRSDVSYNDADYTNYANRLYEAMKGLGTDEDAIFSVFMMMNTDSDVRKLINAFGSRKGENLAQWLLGDLSTSDIDEINAILSKNGINYRF